MAQSEGAPDMGAFGRLLRQHREHVGLSQERLAKAAGISVWTLRRWEQRGQTPLVKVLVKVAKVLEVSLDDLVGYTPPAKKGGA